MPSSIPADSSRKNAGRAPRVLQLLHSNESGGVEALAGLIGAGLAARGALVETHFLYPAFEVGSAVKLRGVAAAVLRLLREKPEVVIAYQGTASVLAGVVGRLAGCRTRIIHQTAIPDAVHPISRMLDKVAGSLGFYTANIANTAATRSAFAAYPAPYRKAMMLIEHGIDPPLPHDPPADVRARHKIDPQSPLLFSAGRLCDQKALDRAILAMPLIPEARLVLAGGGPNEAALRELAASLKVSERIHFLGYLPREEVANLLGAADVFVFPTRWETFGLAPVEAAMLGVPIVASDLPVLREVLSIDGQSPARFVDAANPNELAAGVRAMLCDPNARAVAQSFAGKVAEKYAMRRMLDAYVRLITHVN